MTDLMIDLETLGNTSNSVIVSIGATLFNIETGEKFEDFYIDVDVDSCLEAGLEVNGSTIMWWLAQSPEARSKLINANGRPLEKALDKLRHWYAISGASGVKRIWGNSNRFDLGILADACKAVDMSVFWDFRAETDVRTLVAFAPEIKKNHVFEGVAHNPVHDCHNQIAYCTKIWNLIHNAMRYHKELSIQNSEE